MLAMHLLASSKKGMSAHQLHRMLGVTYKTAWFMAHRIREAMDDKTDESNLYPVTGAEFASHRRVKHTSGEDVRYEDGTAIHTSTVENVFSVFKRGMKGVYQHCSEKHLHRYVTEFGFRFNHRTGLACRMPSAP